VKAVAYCRVSTKEQVKNTSLETQQQAINAYSDREGIEVVRVFMEEGESAKTADRTQLRELLAYCRSNPVDLLLVWKFDRFARDLEQHIGLRTKLRSLGVQVRSVTEPVGEDPAGKLMENVLASFAQFDNDVRAQRTRAGMKARAEQGYWTTRPPIGYVRVVDHQGKSNLAPDPDRAPFVRTAFDLVARGTVPIEDVRRQLVTEGFKTTTGRPVAPQTFHRMLRNPAYSGRVVVATMNVDVPAAFPALVDDRTIGVRRFSPATGWGPRFHTASIRVLRGMRTFDDGILVYGEEGYLSLLSLSRLPWLRREARCAPRIFRRAPRHALNRRELPAAVPGSGAGRVSARR